MDFVYAYSSYALRKPPLSDSLVLNSQALMKTNEEGVSNFICNLAPNIEKQAANFNLDVSLY